MNYSKTTTIPYIPSSIWRNLFLFRQSFVFKMRRKEIKMRNSVIVKSYRNSKVWIYTGRRWHARIINWWMVGFKFGAFTWNRKRAKFKSKKKKKKKK